MCVCVSVCVSLEAGLCRHVVSDVHFKQRILASVQPLFFVSLSKSKIFLRSPVLHSGQFLPLPVSVVMNKIPLVYEEH